MAKVFPGGSSVTKGFPASLGPTPTPDLWTVTYEVDFRNESAFSFAGLGVGTRSIQGADWYQGDEGNASLIAINSNGFQITPDDDGRWDGTNSDSPRIAVPLEDVCSAWDPYTTVAIQALYSASTTLSHQDALGFTVQTQANPGTGGAMFYSIRQVYNSGVKDSLIGRADGDSTSADYAATGSGSMMEMVLFPGNGLSAIISGSEFVDPLTATGNYKASGCMGALRAIAPTGALSLEKGNTVNTRAWIQIYASRESASNGSGFTATLTKFRVLVAKRSV